MLKKPRDFTAIQCMYWMCRFNPGKVNLYPCRLSPQYLIALVPIMQLKFPESWYYCESTKVIRNASSNIVVRLITKN